jgi:hypothetical protein
MLTEREMNAGQQGSQLAMGGADGGYDPSCGFLDNAGVDAKPDIRRGSPLPREIWT